MQKRSLAAMMAALAVSVVVADTADAQFRMFGRGRNRGASWSGNGYSYSPGGYYGGGYYGNGYYDSSYNTGWSGSGMTSGYSYPQTAWSNSYPSTTYSSGSFYAPTTTYTTGGSTGYATGSSPCMSPYPIYSPHESRTTQGAAPSTSQSFYTPRPMETRDGVEAVPIGEKTHDGVVVKVGTNTLTMRSGTTNEEHTHFVPADAKVTRDGSSAKLDDLRKDDLVVVTTKTNPEMTVLKVDARQKK